MNHVPGLLAFLGLIFTLIGCHAWMQEESTNAGLPLVHASVRNGFVCTPTTTPRIRFERKGELV